jgi:hypothetical protein
MLITIIPLYLKCCWWKLLSRKTVINSGYSGKLAFNAATSYKDKLYIGLNLNSHFIDLRQSSVL